MGIFMQKFLKKFRQKPLFMLLPSAAAFLILSVLFFTFTRTQIRHFPNTPLNFSARKSAEIQLLSTTP